MKKLLLLCALCALAANLNAADDTLWVQGTPWKAGTAETYPRYTHSSDVEKAVGKLFRAFLYKEPSGVLAKDYMQAKAFENAAIAAAKNGDFSQLDTFGKLYPDLKMHGSTLPEWIDLAKSGKIPATALNGKIRALTT